MRRISALLLAVLVLAVAVVATHPLVVHAYDPFKGACGSTTGGSSPADSTACKSNQGTQNPLVGSGGVLNNVVDILSIVGGIVTVIIIIVAGFKYITSGGDSAATASAKKTIIYGLVGLLVIILARSIVAFVLTKL